MSTQQKRANRKYMESLLDEGSICNLRLKKKNTNAFQRIIVSEEVCMTGLFKISKRAAI